MKKFGLFLLLLCSFEVVYAQDASQVCSSPRQSQGALVGAFRVMNTAEMRFYAANKRYATLPELLNYEETKKLSANTGYSQPVEGSVAIGTADNPLPGYNARIIVGADGKSYVITATKNDGPCKGVGATTDERGLIYFIEPLR